MQDPNDTEAKNQFDNSRPYVNLTELPQINPADESAEELQSCVAQKPQEKIATKSAKSSTSTSKSSINRENKLFSIEAQESLKAAFKTSIKVVKILFAVILISVLLFLGAFCLEKWMPNNDSNDIQGIWTVEPTTGNIQIDSKNFILDSHTSYSYTINTVDKSIVCTLNDYKGTCQYRFSKDTNKLLIINGQASFFHSLFADISWFFEKHIACLFKEGQTNIYICYEKELGEGQIVTLDRCS